MSTIIQRLLNNSKIVIRKVSAIIQRSLNNSKIVIKKLKYNNLKIVNMLLVM